MVITKQRMQFDHNQNIFLEDERVQLRPLRADDLELLAHFAVEEPEIWKFSLVAVNGVEGLNDYIDSALKAKAEGKEYPFIVFDKKLNAIAGCTRFYDIQPANDTLQLGYTWYGKNYQGTGLNKHCKYLLLQFAFERLGAVRVEFRADNNNAKSIAAMKSIGCTAEGVLRGHLPIAGGGRRDSIILSILKEEWLAGIKDRLKHLLM